MEIKGVLSVTIAVFVWRLTFVFFVFLKKNKKNAIFC